MLLLRVTRDPGTPFPPRIAAQCCRRDSRSLLPSSLYRALAQLTVLGRLSSSAGAQQTPGAIRDGEHRRSRMNGDVDSGSISGSSTQLTCAVGLSSTDPAFFSGSDLLRSMDSVLSVRAGSVCQRARDGARFAALCRPVPDGATIDLHRLLFQGGLPCSHFSSGPRFPSLGCGLAEGRRVRFD